MEFTKAKIIDIESAPEFKDMVSASLSIDELCSVDMSEYTIFPGFCDVHVHFREPGFSYK